MTGHVTSEATSGLSEADVAERVRLGQRNITPKLRSRSPWEIARANIFTPFNALLGGLLVVILIVGPIHDALFGAVLIANAAIGIVQEVRAKRTLDRLSVLTAPKATVVRDGTPRDIPMGDVVQDDVLAVSTGDQIVVDGVVLSSSQLEIDESLLTGEADPVAKDAGAELLSGSFVSAGGGRYRATRVGGRAYAAALTEEARKFMLVQSDLRNGINRIIAWVSWALIPSAGLLLYSQLRSQDGIADAIRSAVAGGVAMVPEGLVLLASVALAVAVVRLARREVLVRELPAVEGLARVDTLCIDKTGTITAGRMVVEKIEPLGSTEGYAAALGALASAEASPNATLRAIAEACPPDGPAWQRTGSVPFSSARKWSAAAFAGQGTWVLGAPDILLAQGADAGGLREKVEAHAAEGRRVLVLCHTDGALDGERIPDGIAPVALILLLDQERGDAAETLRYFEAQGVSVKVISGDHPATVAAIARRVGLAGSDAPLDARDLKEDDPGYADAIGSGSVFGRVTPQQKRSMVKALQSRGHVVAMTGDGVNDVLALRDADIGIAMGSGSPASRAAADLVLLDSAFAGLPSVVGEGRRVLANIERTAALFLTKTVYALILAIGVGLASLPFPFLPRQLTLISGLTIGIPGFVLTLAPNTRRAQPGFTRRVLHRAVPSGILAAGATFATFVVARNTMGSGLPAARTAATVVLCLMGFVIVWKIARPFNAEREVMLIVLAGVLVASLAVPSLREFFALPLPRWTVFVVTLAIAAVFGIALALLPIGDQASAD